MMGFSHKNMVELQEILRLRTQTITTAESCTGGLIASRITQMSGSSDIFRGAIVCYSNDIKEQELNVKKENLQLYGAVSEAVVQDMLDGVIDKFDADYAIAVSGIAGPTGGTVLKPVGTVVIGIASKESKKIKTYHFKGNRQQIQNQSATKALKKLLKLIKSS